MPLIGVSNTLTTGKPSIWFHRACSIWNTKKSGTMYTLAVVSLSCVQEVANPLLGPHRERDEDHVDAAGLGQLHELPQVAGVRPLLAGHFLRAPLGSIVEVADELQPQLRRVLNVAGELHAQFVDAADGELAAC